MFILYTVQFMGKSLGDSSLGSWNSSLIKVSVTGDM